MEDFIRGAFAGSPLELPPTSAPAAPFMRQEQLQQQQAGPDYDDQCQARGWYVPQESVVERKAPGPPRFPVAAPLPDREDPLPDDPLAKAAAIARRIALRTNAGGSSGWVPENAVDAPSEPERPPGKKKFDFEAFMNSTGPSRRMQENIPRHRPIQEEVQAFEGPRPTGPHAGFLSEVPLPAAPGLQEPAEEAPAPPPEEPKKKVSMVLNNVLGKFQAAAAASIQSRKLQPKAAPIGSISTKPQEDDDYLDEPAMMSTSIGAAHAGGLGATSSVAEEGAGRTGPFTGQRSFKERSRSRKADETRRKRDAAFASESPERMEVVKKPPPKLRSPSRKRARKSIFSSDQQSSAARPPMGGVIAAPIQQFFGPDDVPLPTELVGRLLGTRGMNMRRIEAHLGGQVQIQILNAPANIKGGMQKAQVLGIRKDEAIAILRRLVAELKAHPGVPIAESRVWQEIFTSPM